MRRATMLRALFLALAAAGALTPGLAAGTDRKTVRAGSASERSGYLFCPCSPTARGASPEVTKQVRGSLADARTAEKAAKEAGMSAADIEDELTKAAIQEAKAYTDVFGYEAVINADAALRKDGVRPFCTYDTVSKKNLRTTKDSDVLAIARSCRDSSKFRSPASALADAGASGAGGQANVGPAGSGSASRSGRSEGCVAVEHLSGFALQHTADLLRPVLCAHGFCATPNHAILVDGRLTSMRRLCAAEWRCVRTTKWVNNLKVAVNRRARVSDRIVVTPYDLRFPKAAVWAVQMLEDVWRIVSASVVAGAVGAAVVLVGVALGESRLKPY